MLKGKLPAKKIMPKRRSKVGVFLVGKGFYSHNNARNVERKVAREAAKTAK